MQATTNNSQPSNSQPVKANGKANGKPVAKQPKASKANGQPKAKAPKASPVITAPANRPGPKAGQQRVTVLGYSLYGFSQWLAAQGYAYPVMQAVIAKLAQNGQPNWATVKTACSDVKNPKYSRPAPVSPAHAKQVAALAKASQPKASKAPKASQPVA